MAVQGDPERAERAAEPEHRGIGQQCAVELFPHPPGGERLEHGLEVATPRGERVDRSRGGRRQLASLHHAVRGEIAQPLREDGGCDAGQAGGEVGEALRAEPEIAHDQHRPAIADDVERPRDRARLAVGPTHLASLYQINSS